MNQRLCRTLLLVGCVACSQWGCQGGDVAQPPQAPPSAAVEAERTVTLYIAGMAERLDIL